MRIAIVGAASLSQDLRWQAMPGPDLRTWSSSPWRALIANKLGITFRVSIEKRIAGAARVGKHKTSMLQDIEAGREPEVDALIGSAIELARLTNSPRPTSTAFTH